MRSPCNSEKGKSHEVHIVSWEGHLRKDRFLVREALKVYRQAVISTLNRTVALRMTSNRIFNIVI